MIKKKKNKTKVAKGVLLISFIILFIRLIYSSIHAMYYYNHDDNAYSSIFIKQETLFFTEIHHKNYIYKIANIKQYILMENK